MRFGYFGQMAQHAQSKLIDHRKQGGELVSERFQSFRRGSATGLNDSFLSRGECRIRESQPGAAFGLKETLLHVSRQRDAALVGFVAEPMEFLFTQVSSELSPHSSLSLTSCSFDASAASVSVLDGEFQKRELLGGCWLVAANFPGGNLVGRHLLPVCRSLRRPSVAPYRSAAGGAYSMRSLFGGGAICASRLKDGSE